LPTLFLFGYSPEQPKELVRVGAIDSGFQIKIRNPREVAGWGAATRCGLLMVACSRVDVCDQLNSRSAS
jgi:hypothetical protein